ncbi:MFS transporter [Pectobacterium parmentieri]|uniref:MFS transporter n=1 Tax=Pectobacterium parmentieri TaxID=1905730 RepID=A0A0H3HZ65_PECPM|nr:MFS transporter [Pectobacterium parmentieri]AFI88704.1 Major facilitator superfamily MFS_1 [Pectobacterium parmentieri]MBI0472895.1 MFS transporter [Pectobacterium parmentieri]MBI0495563.1 MFS transporter [Pectobacterium parmentieri]MBI0556860.1 MFS transporter [Pectobacterium parmentieri]MBI0570038.1 MFS transporter [Pectobacterium parmentieri]
MDESMYRQHTRSVVHLALLINMLSLGSLVMLVDLSFISVLSMDAKNIGYISSGSTFASAIVGFLTAPYLDRFNRKHALLVLLMSCFGLTVTCMFAANQTHLLLLLILAAMLLTIRLIPQLSERSRKIAARQWRRVAQPTHMQLEV